MAALSGAAVQDTIFDPLTSNNDKYLYVYWTEHKLALRKKELSDLLNVDGITVTSVTHF